MDFIYITVMKLSFRYLLPIALTSGALNFYQQHFSKCQQLSGQNRQKCWIKAVDDFTKVRWGTPVPFKSKYAKELK